MYYATCTDGIVSEMNSNMSYKVEKKSHLFVFRLNRPDKINALNQEMALALSDAVTEFEQNSEFKIFLLLGEGEKGFCGGGDVKAGNPDFFHIEYDLNLRLSQIKKPFLCLGHGLLMGGGVGLWQNAHARLIDETTQFAMPEPLIGFFPDVGAMHTLCKLGPLGLFLGLTSSRLNSVDLLHFGVATHLIPSGSSEELVKILSATTNTTTTTTTSSFSSSSDSTEQHSPSGLWTEIENALQTIENSRRVRRPEAQCTPEVLEEIQFLVRPRSFQQLNERMLQHETKSSFVQIALDNYKLSSPRSLSCVFHYFHAAKLWSFSEIIEKDRGLPLLFYPEELKTGVEHRLVNRRRDRPVWRPIDREFQAAIGEILDF